MNVIKKAKLLQDFFYLRKMEEDDLPDVLKIENLSYSKPWHVSSFKGEIDNYPISNAYVIVYRPLNKVIGYIIYWHVEKKIQISNIAVSPDFRMMGIAEAVIRQVIVQIKREGAEFVLLEVRPSNYAARSLYNKLGFKVLGIRKNYYSDPREDAMLMGKSLA